MSRSYKKNPIVRDAKRASGKFLKRRMNRRIRQMPNDIFPIHGHGAFLKDLALDPYDRSDWIREETFREFMNRAYLNWNTAKEKMENFYEGGWSWGWYRIKETYLAGPPNPDVEFQNWARFYLAK